MAAHESSLDLAQLGGVVAEALSLDDTPELTRSPTGKFNDTFFAEGKGLAKPLVVRVAPEEDRARMLFYEHRMMRQEPELHRLLREKTGMPVPEILFFEAQNPVIRRDFLVMERMPGAPLGNPGDSGRVFRELGGKLREVHDSVRAERGAYGYLGAHRPMAPQATWREAFEVMWDLLIADIEHCGAYDAEEGARWRALLSEYGEAFGHFEEPGSLLHMDVWAENILCDTGGKLTGLIDWDRALWGDPEIEFAVLDYCGISDPSFWEGYGRERPSGKDAEIRRIIYLLYEVQKYIVIRIARQGNAAGADRYRRMAEQLAGLLTP